LTKQLLYAPLVRRAAAVRHAEQLHDEIEEDQNYPIDFVVYRLTERRVPPEENVMLVGEAILPDLRLLIDALSRSFESTDDDADKDMKTTREWAQELAVSTKTIARWRDRGLRWRWGVRSGKPAVLIARSAIDRFDERFDGIVSNASAFTRLSEDEADRLLRRIRRLATATNVSPQAIFAHLAKRTGRSVETLRQLVQRHDERCPDAMLFRDRVGTLTGKQKRIIERAYRRGVTVARLSERFAKTRPTIYRAIHECRAERIRGMAIQPIVLPVFERDDADEVLMQPITREGETRELARQVLATLSESLRRLYDRPIEPDQVVRSRIVRYHFWRYRLAMLQRQIVDAPPRAADLDRFDALLQRCDKTRGSIIAAVLPVTLSVVRRQMSGDEQKKTDVPTGMLYLANRVLIEEIDRFNPTVQHTFESVLTNRLLRVLANQSTSFSLAHIEPESIVQQLLDAGFDASRD
jgi:hypothetical protein